MFIILIVFHLETKVFLSKKGFIQMEVYEIDTEFTPMVKLKGECSELNIYVSPEQAFAIQQGLQGVKSFRPGTHDTLINILSNFQIKPVLVKVTKLQDNTYFAELILQRWNHFLILDTRPSDAIAIAVRTNTPIYVNEGLIKRTC